MTPLGVHPQCMLKMKSERDCSNSSQCAFVKVGKVFDALRTKSLEMRKSYNRKNLTPLYRVCRGNRIHISKVIIDAQKA